MCGVEWCDVVYGGMWCGGVRYGGMWCGGEWCGMMGCDLWWRVVWYGGV